MLIVDDGEMQCSQCAEFGVWDYKREPLEKLEYAVFLARAKRAEAALREGQKG